MKYWEVFVFRPIQCGVETPESTFVIFIGRIGKIHKTSVFAMKGTSRLPPNNLPEHHNICKPILHQNS
jgi:hypothetical protein